MTTRLVVLAYNEEAGMGQNLTAIQGLGLPDLDVIVVDDGSTDRTEAIVRQMKETVPLELLSHEVNRGVAAAFDTVISGCFDCRRPLPLRGSLEPSIFFLRDGCTRGGSPGAFLYCGGHGASPSPSASCFFTSSSSPPSDPAAS